MGQTLLPGNQTAINAEMRGNFFDRQPTFIHKKVISPNRYETVGCKSLN